MCLLATSEESNALQLNSHNNAKELTSLISTLNTSLKEKDGDVLEWFNWIQSNFLIIKDMIESYEKKLKKRRGGAAKIAMMKMRAMIAKGKAKKLKTEEEKKAEAEALAKEAGETESDKKTADAAEDVDDEKSEKSADDEKKPEEETKELLGTDPSMDDMKKILGSTLLKLKEQGLSGKKLAQIFHKNSFDAEDYMQFKMLAQLPMHQVASLKFEDI